VITATAFRAQSGPWQSGVEIYVGNQDTRVKDIILEKIDPAEFIAHPPSFTVSRDIAQTLMDDLWQCGIRPTEGTGSAGSLRATERHLADMRTIAFAKLNMEASP
jgi:hypothetical protein